MRNRRTKGLSKWKGPFQRYSDGPEYSCPHGTGHSTGVHGCCGCCNHKSFKKRLRMVYYKEWHQKRKLQPDYLTYHKKIQARWYKKHAHSTKQRLIQRGNRLRCRYWPDKTWQEALIEYDLLLTKQRHRCYICRVHKSKYKMPLQVDHCHITNIVRGLLCPICNRFIVSGIDIRAKAQKVQISKKQLIKNIVQYFKNYDPIYNHTIESAKKVCEYLKGKHEA